MRVRCLASLRYQVPCRLIHASIVVVMAVVLNLAADLSYAQTNRPLTLSEIRLERLSSGLNGGYGYKLQYLVPVPVENFWRFKTEFDGEHLLTNDELIGHRLVKSFGNSVITENQYASAPGLTFLWKTTAYPKQYRLEFKLLNAEDSRHDFHYGSIQLIDAGEFTRVIQIAYFNFTGASLWVRYPWYGGMKSTLTRVAMWEQKTALKYARPCRVARSF